jgi:HTH-type transcriptional regulator/antitoxin HigA
MRTKLRKKPGTLSDAYFELVRRHPLRSIQTETDLDAAHTVIDDLLRRDLDHGGMAYLDALSDLVILYERDHHAIAPLPPHELLAHVLEERGMSQAELVRKTGIAKATVSDLVGGKRPFTVDHMQRIAAVFGLPAAAFMPAKTIGR